MTDNTNITQQATCPTCGERGSFDYAGEQAIPARVAEALGLSAKMISMWHCPNCNSTISEPDLIDCR